MRKSALRHECEKYGCARRFLDPHLSDFDDCFPRSIRLGDIDASVELNGHILWVEWKLGAVLEAFEDMHRAQFLQAKAFTANSPRQMFVFVVGPIDDGARWVWRVLRNGAWDKDWRFTGEAGLRDFFKWWAQRADNLGSGRVREARP